MSNMPGMTEESKAWILGMAFKGERTSDLFLGLSLAGISPESLDELAASLDANVVLKAVNDVTLENLVENEPVDARGYSRRRLEPDDWTISDELSVQVESVPVTFRNTGAEKWPSVNVAFLATADGILVAWTFLQATRDLFFHDELIETMVVAF